MRYDIGILLSSASLNACLAHKKTYEVMPLYEKYARQNGLRPVFFTLAHLNFRHLTVHGFVKDGHQYVQRTFPLPTVIHNRTRLSPKHEGPLKQLRNTPYTAVFNGSNYFNKWRVYRLLQNNLKLRAHLPATHRLQMTELRPLFDQHTTLYFKPFAKSLGQGVIRCSHLPDNQVQISYQKNGALYQRTVHPIQISPFLRTACDARYIAQQAVSLAQKEDHPIDFRVSVQKGARGEWRISGIVARMGLKNAVVTNVAAGGKCVPAKPLLKQLFPKDYPTIYHQLQQVALTVAKQLEQHDSTCADLGLDLAVDRDGHVWFIEVNGRDLRVTFYHAKEYRMWQETFKRPMDFAAFLKRQENSGVQSSDRPSVAFLTPGVLPVPASKGGAVETVVTRIAEKLVREQEVYTLGTASSQAKGEAINLIPVPRLRRNTYLRQAVGHLRRLEPDVIQIENRPSYVSAVRKAFPHQKIILNLHSVTFVQPAVLTQENLFRSFAACDAIVTNSSFLKEELQKMAPPFHDKIHPIHLGVDAETFRPAPKNDPVQAQLKAHWGLGNQPVVLFIGRLIPQKGLHCLIEAMAHVLNKVPNAVLVIVGGSFYGRNVQTPYVKKLRQKATPIKDHIRWIPFVSPNHIHRYYSLGDVFVAPSLGKEAFGLVNVEAMASGLPVVAFDTGGVSEVVVQGKTGYLIAPHSQTETLANKIAILLRDKATRRDFGTAGRERALSYFSWDRVAKDYQKLYDSLTHAERRR